MELKVGNYVRYYRDIGGFYDIGIITGIEKSSDDEGVNVFHISGNDYDCWKFTENLKK